MGKGRAPPPKPLTQRKHAQQQQQQQQNKNGKTEYKKRPSPSSSSSSAAASASSVSDTGEPARKRNKAGEDSLFGLFTTDSEEASSIASSSAHKAMSQGGMDSRARAEKIFEWLIYPLTSEQFYADYFEKKPLLIRRSGCSSFYDWLRYRKTDIEEWTKENEGKLQYGVHLDVARVISGNRETLNKVNDEGAGQIVNGRELWRLFSKDGCSIRTLHPQQHHSELRALISVLEDYWQCSTGCNAYLTPPGCQGFSPHFDDVCAFILQTEGKKRWRLYGWRDDSDRLARFSSPNFLDDPTEIGEPIFDEVLEEGDMLYMPRGIIHQGIVDERCGESHSLHATISTALHNSWYDLLKEALSPAALESAMLQDSAFRESLPLHTMNHMGVMHADSEDPRRNVVVKRFTEMVEKLLDYLPLDAAADRLAVTHIRSRLPPHAPDARLPKVLPRPEAEGDSAVHLHSRVRIISATAARLVMEEETAVVYSPVQNRPEKHASLALEQVAEQGKSKVDEGKCDDDIDTLCVEFDIELAEAIDALISAYPQYVAVSELPCDPVEALDLARVLYEQGVLQVKS